MCYFKIFANAHIMMLIQYFTYNITDKYYQLNAI